MVVVVFKGRLRCVIRIVYEFRAGGGLHTIRRPKQYVIPHILADSRQFGHYRDAMLFECADRTDGATPPRAGVIGRLLQIR